jgi:transcriptional regulator with XRE-family HTH domain
MPGMGNGLKMLREGRGWSQQRAADQFGYSFEGYKKIEYGKRRLSADVIDRACQIYGVSEGEVMGRATTGHGGVALVGYVGAGNEAHYYANGDNPREEVERPPESTPQTVAVEIRGDSLYPIADDRDLIYYDDVKTPPTDDMIGKLCVVGLEDDRILVKRLHMGRAPGTYDLLSPNAPPITGVALTWAARVKWIKPR